MSKSNSRTRVPDAGFFAFLILLALSACRTAPALDPDAAAGEPAASGSEGETVQFYAEASEVLAAGQYDLFFEWLNRNGTSRRDDVDRLLGEYGETQTALFLHFFDANELFQARHHRNNLVALRGIDDEAVRLFASQLTDAMNRSELSGTLRSFRNAIDLLDQADGPEPSASILTAEFPADRFTALNGLIAQIDVQRNYRNEDGLLRRDTPYFSGTAIQIAPDYLLSAYHVVSSVYYRNTTSYTITCRFAGDAAARNVTIAARDSITDLVLLRLPQARPIGIEIKDLFGDSNLLAPGQEIYALGHSSGMTNSLTRGIISANRRRAPEVGDWIQFDASVEGGASGGIVFGPDGRVYGLIDAKIPGSDLNFAIPSNEILGVLEQLQAGRSIPRPWLGVLLEREEGVSRIRYRFPGSPLRSLSAEAGDRITAINGIPVASVEAAQDLLGCFEAGNLARVEITKANGFVSTGWIVLPRRPDFPLFNANLGVNERSSLYAYFGIEVNEEDRSSRTLYNTSPSQTGPQSVIVTVYAVTRVEPDSFFADCGIQGGDSVGFLFDGFEGRSRVLSVLHVPQGVSFGSGTDIEDYIYTYNRGGVDDHIL